MTRPIGKNCCQAMGKNTLTGNIIGLSNLLKTELSREQGISMPVTDLHKNCSEEFKTCDGYYVSTRCFNKTALAQIQDTRDPLQT